MKRKLDEANERAAQAERDRAIAYKTNAFMIMNHMKKDSNLQNELLQKQKELEKLTQQLRENDVGVMRMKLKKTEEDLKNMETKYAVSKRLVENMKKEMEDAAMKNEKKMEETKMENEKTIAALKKQVEDAEQEKEKDEVYAVLKKELEKVKFYAKIDDQVIHKAYIKIGALERELITAKGNEKNDESKAEEPKATDPLKGCSQELISRMTSVVTMEDIAGLEFVKRCINELIVWPMSRPDAYVLYLDIWSAWNGQNDDWQGDRESIWSNFVLHLGFQYRQQAASGRVRVSNSLFAVAAAKQPSVIFIDEIDSMLTKRSDDDSGFCRAIKTEFMVQLDGMAPTQNDSILIVGATNCPHTLDEAIRRRFVKRMYIPLPSTETRAAFTQRALQDIEHNLNADDLKRVAELSEGFSCADMRALCTEAALYPVRAIPDIRKAKAEDIRPIQHEDFTQALGTVKASVGNKDLKLFEDWNAEFGTTK